MTTTSWNRSLNLGKERLDSNHLFVGGTGKEKASQTSAVTVMRTRKIWNRSDTRIADWSFRLTKKQARASEMVKTALMILQCHRKGINLHLLEEKWTWDSTIEGIKIYWGKMQIKGSRATILASKLGIIRVTMIALLNLSRNCLKLRARGVKVGKWMEFSTKNRWRILSTTKGRLRTVLKLIKL